MGLTTNDITNVYFNINQQDRRGPRTIGPRGMDMPPVVSFNPRPDFDCYDGMRGPEGRPGPWRDELMHKHVPGHCHCGGGGELANFGNSEMGASLGKAAEKSAKYNGIANVLQSIIGYGGLFGNGGLSNLLNGGLSSIFSFA